MKNLLIIIVALVTTMSVGMTVSADSKYNPFGDDIVITETITGEDINIEKDYVFNNLSEYVGWLKECDITGIAFLIIGDEITGEIYMYSADYGYGEIYGEYDLSED